jgi:hypothetical protein
MSWNCKTLLKIKIFMWLLRKRNMLTKEQLLKRDGRVPLLVCFVVFLKILIIFLFRVIWFRLYGIGLLIIILLLFKIYL